MNSRIARITIGRTQINNHIDKLELDRMDLFLDDPMTMRYVIASYCLYHTPPPELDQRFWVSSHVVFQEVY